MGSIVGSRSGYGRDSGSIVELQDDRILIDRGPGRSDGSVIPGYVYHIPIFLDTAYDSSKSSGSNGGPRGILGDRDGRSAGIIGLVGSVVGMCYDSIGLPVAIGTGIKTV